MTTETAKPKRDAIRIDCILFPETGGFLKTKKKRTAEMRYNTALIFSKTYFLSFFLSGRS